MKFKLLIFVLFAASLSYSQYNNLLFEHLTIEDGLSQSSVRTIMQDSKGFMWFGTNDGLNRYDGYRFKVFRNDIYDSLSISNNEIYSVSEDAEGYLWVATANGLNRYDRMTETFIRYNFSPGSYGINISGAIVSVLAYKNKNQKITWFTTRDGILKFDLVNNKIKIYTFPDNPAEKNKTISLFRDSNDDLWAGIYIGGVYKYNKEKDAFDKVYFDDFSYKYPDLYVTQFYEDKERNICFGTLNGLNIYNLDTKKIKRYKTIFEEASGVKFQTGFINGIVEGNDGNLCIGSSGYGLMIFNKKNETVKIFTHDPYDKRTVGLDVSLSVYKDKSGIIWIGTNGNGIDRLNPHINKFNLVTKTLNGLSVNSVRTFFEDAAGKLWISGYSSLNKYDPGTGKYKYYYLDNQIKLPRYSDNVVYSIEADKDNPKKFLYFGTEGSGINRFDMEGETYTKIYPQRFSPSNPGNYIIYCLYDDGKGWLWFGTNQGLSKLQKSSNKLYEYHYDPKNPESIRPQAVTSFLKDSFGNFWIGTNLGGLNLMDTEKEKFTYFLCDPKNDNTISGNYVKCIYEDTKHNLWIGTTSGLNKFIRETKSFKRYNVKNGLPNDVIYGILEDDDGNLWLSTNLGISKFNPVNETFQNFDIRDGLQSNEFNSNAYIKTRSGEMFFGGINGFNSFSPRKIQKNSNIPPVVITDIQLFNYSLPIGEKPGQKVYLENSASEIKELILDYSDNVITIEFAALDYSARGKNQYSYRLEGFDNGWSVPRIRRNVTYTNLDPGKYTFRVKGTNNSGLWNNAGASFTIIIRPPFWRTWWFYIIVFFVIISLLLLIEKIRTKNIQTTNRKLEAQVKERTARLNEVNESLKIEVAERKNAEEELRLLNIQKDKFFSIIAHDLKSPFHGLLGYSELLANEYDSLSEEEKVTFIKDIQDISKSTFRFLENLLEWSRIQTGRVEFAPENINLHNEIKTNFNILSGNAANKKINLINDVGESVNVLADQNMLNLILRNLISNAIKYTGESGAIRVYSLDKDNLLDIVVEDNGIGISPDNLGKLFRIDVQYSSKGTNEEEGTGLGLLLCKEMVEMNNGTIRVESKLGAGTKFIFSLPKGL